MPIFKADTGEIVEAEMVVTLLHHAANAWDRLPEWIRSEHEKGNVLFKFEWSKVFIQTPEGEIQGPLRNWLVRNPDGQIYGYTPLEFVDKYEPIAGS